MTRRALVLLALIGLALPAAASAQRRVQVVLPGPVPYATPEPPLIGRTALPQVYIAPRLHVSSDQVVAVGVGPDGRPVRVRVRQRLVVHGKGDYQLAVGGPIDDVAQAPGSDSSPGLRSDQLLWAGFSPGRKVLAADVFLRARGAAEHLPVRVEVERQDGRAFLSVRNATTTPQQVYSGTVRVAELARLLDETRRSSLAGTRLKGTYATFIGEVRTLKTPFPIAAPLHVTGSLVVPGHAPVSFDRILGDGRPLSFRVAAAGAGAPRVHLRATPAPVSRLLRPPGGAPTWSAAARRSKLSANDLVLRLMTTRMQLVRADQFQAFLADPDTDGRTRATYEYDTVAVRRAAPARASAGGGGGGGDALLVVLVVAGCVLAAGGGLVAWAHS